MVYIYKKSMGGKNYYYLRASERKGKRILVKDIAYLGDSIEGVKKKLEHLPRYKSKIRKAYKKIHSFLESNHYLEKAKTLRLKKDSYLLDKTEEVEACRIHYNEQFKKQDKFTKEDTLKNFVVEFSFNTTSIEGNTITLQETRNLLHEGITPKGRTLREIYDLQNTEKVFFSLHDSKKELTHELIIDVHSKLMENIDPRKGYRNVDVRVLRSNFDATPAPFVKTDMDLLIRWYQKNAETLHPLVLATIFHHKFEKIHPFADGNGRTGRMLLNYILLKKGYPPMIIRKKYRAEYLEALGTADKSKPNGKEIRDYAGLVRFSALEFTEIYWDVFL